MNTRRFILLIFSAAIAGIGLTVINSRHKVQRVEAAGNIVITYLDAPLSGPVFSLTDLKPGDCEVRTIKVKNNGEHKEEIRVTGKKTGGIGSDPLLENILDFLIREKSVDQYGGIKGDKTLARFFIDSNSGLILGNLGKNKETSFDFKVCFPFSAGNEYQNKSVIFDLVFKNQGNTQTNIKINEIYYIVDNKHGIDCNKDKKENSICKDPGWLNQMPLFLRNRNLPGVGSIFCGCSCTLGGCNEWVELYNPTDKAVNLKGWQLSDNSGKVVQIAAKKIIPAYGFALISKDAATWTFWKIPKKTLLIELGSVIGDGLGNDGDHLDLLDPEKNVIDRVGWGSDILVWNPAVTLVLPGASIERKSIGFDNDLVTDWQEKNPPTPGN